MLGPFSGSQILTAFVSLVYLSIAGFHFKGNRLGLGIAFTAYATANIGLILAEWGR